MKPINKTQNKATKFVADLTTHLATNSNHPDYETGKFRDIFYKDVFVALLFCQNGLCAYTEELICDVANLKETDWENGVYIGEIIPQNYDADIEHFDSTLKQTQGWLLENLFAVGVAINRKNKHTKPVYSFINPSLANYKPENYLSYDFSTHKFVTKTKIVIEDPVLAKQVKEMIEVLGLNYGTTRDRRARYLSEKAVDIQKGQKSFEEVRATLYQFFTAFEMCKIEFSIKLPT
jgi:hypothetical protein